MAIINFNNHVEETLWLCELSGQISDGHWENARPHDHWVFWCRCKTTVDPLSDPGVFKYDSYEVLKNGYNFCAKDLLDVVADRMLAGARLSIVLGKTLTREQYNLTEYFSNFLDMSKNDESISADIVYEYNKFPLSYSVKEYGKSVDIGDLITSFRHESCEAFTMSNLRKALKDISHIIKGTSKF